MDCSNLLELVDLSTGVVLPVKAKPAARKNAITGFFNNYLKVSVTTAPEKGKANKAIIKLLAKELKITPRNIALLSGETSSEKKFIISSLSSFEIIKKISELDLHQN